jgi:hypothetical protein
MGSYKDKEPLDLLIPILKNFVIIAIIGSCFLLIYIPYKGTIDDAVKRTLSPIPEYAIESSKGDFSYENPNKVEDGIHLASGLIYDENFSIVKKVCTRCHSAKIITQTRATQQGWEDMLTWMQKTQGLEDLGSYRPTIINYLSKHYAPTKIGRRANLDMSKIDWYRLNE